MDTHSSTQDPSAAGVAEEAAHGLDEMRGRFEELGKQAVEFVRERPGTSLLIAIGAGYLIGRILK